MGTRRTQGIVTLAIAGVVLLGVLYMARVLLLFAGATEGDVPDAARLQLPAGAEVIRQAEDCASGGGWVTLRVRPPSGQSPEDLAAEIGATPQLEIAGNLLDPRPVWVWAEPSAATLSLRVDYWSRKYIP